MQLRASRAWVTFALVAANILVYVAMVSAGADPFKPKASLFLSWGANYGPLSTQGEPWRLVSALFLHVGLTHLAFNMWALYDAGRVVERLYGSAAFAVLYLLAGVGGSVGSLLWRQDVLSVGASGAVFGVYGALLAFLGVHRHSVPPAVLRGLLMSALLFVAISLFFGFTQKGIDNAAHLGGLLSGAAVGWALALPRARLGGRYVVAAVVAGALLAGGWALVPPVPYSYAKERAFQTELHRFVDEEAALMADLKVLVARYQDGELTEGALVRAVETQVLPRWHQIYLRLALAAPDPASPSRATHTRVLRYVALRRDAVEALVLGVRRHDMTQIRRFEALKAEGDRILQEIESGG